MTELQDKVLPAEGEQQEAPQLSQLLYRLSISVLKGVDLKAQKWSQLVA